MLFDITSVGHLTVDTISTPKRSKPFASLGGSAAYTSCAARSLDMTASIISRVGGDFPVHYWASIERIGVDLSRVLETEAAETTSFRITYNRDFSRRKLQVVSKAPPITTKDLHDCAKAKIIHVAPVTDEISLKVMEKLRKNANWISLDPQGLVRSFDREGNLTLDSLLDKKILKLIDVYKSTRREIECTTGIADLKSAMSSIRDCGVRIVLVTLGSEGALLSTEENTWKIPAYSPVRVVDPTGAGDVFVGAFLAESMRSRNAIWCACVGSAAASLSVEVSGPANRTDKVETYRRASTLYEKQNKQ